MRSLRAFATLVLVAVGIPLGSISASARDGAPSCIGATATIVGTQGSDHIIGTPHADVIVARGGDDRVSGRGGHDRICGGAGDDRIRGDRAVDWIEGGSERDTLLDGASNDTIRGGLGADTMSGGSGTDLIDVPGALTLARGTTRIRSRFGGHVVGAGNDKASGGDGRDFMRGRGDDVFHGDADNDEMTQQRAGPASSSAAVATT